MPRSPSMVVLAALSAVSMFSVASGQTTFTYQGSLQALGSPASGLFDLRFRLYDTAAGGTEVAATLCADNVAVAAGLFTVQLDFGGAFDTVDERFLEIDVREDAGLPCANAAGFVTLGPRTQITRTPLAQHAISARNALNSENADNATNLGGQSSSFYRNASNLNAGTVNDTRLSTNVPRLNAANIFSGAVTLSNPLNVIAGDGSGLLSLSAAALVGQLTGSQIADNAITTFHIAPAAIINSDISDNSISTNKLVNGAVTSFKLGVGSVAGGVGGTIVDGTIGNADLQASIITSTNIVDGTIAGIDIANGAVNGFHIATDSLTSLNLGAGSVGSSELLDGAVGTADLAGNAVTAAKIAADAVNSSRLALDSASLARVSGGFLQSNGTGIGINGAPLATHELFVEGKIKATTGLDSNGTITAAEFVFANPFPRVYNVGPYDMVRMDNGIHFGEINGNEHDGFPFLNNGSILISTSCGAPVHLPDGAIVESVEIRAVDTSDFAMTAFLFRRGFDGSSGGTMAQIATTGDVANTIRSFSDFTISAPIVDNANFQYFLTLKFPPGSQPINFYGAIIRYRVPRPLP